MRVFDGFRYQWLLFIPANTEYVFAKLFNVKCSLIALSPALKYRPPKGDPFSEQKICSKIILIHCEMPESKELASALLFNMTTSQDASLESTCWNSTNDMYMHHAFLLELASWFPGWASSAKMIAPQGHSYEDGASWWTLSIKNAQASIGMQNAGFCPI